MADSLRRVQAGDNLVITAETWNLLLDTADKLRSRGGVFRAGEGSAEAESFSPCSVIRFENTTGSTVPAFAVLTPTGASPDPDTDGATALSVRRRPVVTASAPITDGDPVLIAFESVGDGQIGRAAVSGVTVARVDLTDTTHRFARPDPGNIFNLVSAASGPVRLLQTFEDAGTYLMLVMLLQGTSGGDTFGQSWGTDNLVVATNSASGTYTDSGASVGIPGEGIYELTVWVRGQIGTSVAAVSLVGLVLDGTGTHPPTYLGRSLDHIDYFEIAYAQVQNDPSDFGAGEIRTVTNVKRIQAFGPMTLKLFVTKSNGGGVASVASSFLAYRRMLDEGGGGPPGPRGEQGEQGPPGDAGANSPDDANAAIGFQIFGA